ncbi:hypothetical protein BEP19_04240 [Ammoniphilus oxalaticus]|uniref:Uncharacterized protein n=1 Tax=Ammoniphilus oxalaticus TaxID=66863 RepID=A0A419SM33_9BACL|nr:HAD domain-containing protein [Ammoniphilus oxalaticus]RKD25042.1 hypothetical protein BEP19_04240 [Ammoniphilus oxalaticus]
MKVIFLDFDGVMITGNVIGQGKFDSECVRNLQEILKQTNAKIVVSSTYRQMGLTMLRDLFTRNGIPSDVLIGVTPITRGPRGEEIQQYLEEAELDPATQIEKFVIIDDYDNMGKVRPYLVQTNRDTGLDETARDRAIEMLSS